MKPVASSWGRLRGVVVALALGLPAVAAAQEGRLQVERFEPRISSGAVLSQPSSLVVGHNRLVFEFWGNYGHRPLVLTPAIEGDPRGPGGVVGGRLRGEVLVGYGLADFLQFSLAVPWSTQLQKAEYGFAGRSPDDLNRSGLGDMRVGFDVDLGRAFGGVDGPARLKGFGVGFGLTGWLPTGDVGALEGEETPRVEPRLVADWTAPFGLRVGGNAGVVLRKRTQLLSFVNGYTLRWGMSLVAPLGTEAVEGVATVFGSAALLPQPTVEDPTVYEPTRAYDHAEWLAGLRVRSPFGLRAQLAAGTGLSGGIGSPAWRVVGSVVIDLDLRSRFRDLPGAKDDRDGDGVPFAEDLCPFEAETRDGIRDEDGCPESHEAYASLGGEAARSVADPGQEVASAAPYRPAAVAGLPPLRLRVDSDGDGFFDDEDLCPTAPEDVDGIADADGCPEDDVDGDGLPDATDACPLRGESINFFEDEDGCPDLGPDEDGDGVGDAFDLCPLEPENRDGVRDLDGCPEAGPDDVVAFSAEEPLPEPLPPVTGLPPLPIDRDLDGDGIGLDDECPEQPEDLDGFEDFDGCPDPDDDGDGILDAADRCPRQAETDNGVRDEDGCPDAVGDADGDGIADPDDVCPFEPEWKDGRRDADGCPEAPPQSLATPTAAAPPEPDPGPPLVRPDGLPPLLPRVDTDGDGILDDEDLCPADAEDLDGLADADGCPEDDLDGDGISDADDECPLRAESRNGVRDEDGCPDVGSDLDGDGVPDPFDRCPYEDETVNGIRDEDGCPETAAALAAPTPAAGAADVAMDLPRAVDQDGDGVIDPFDACPLEPEDADGFEDLDGCPDLDNDDDGVTDRLDRCPLEAENRNGLLDDDGCPDRGPDADFDLVDDSEDRCPWEPENRDGVRDEDGCPESWWVAVPAAVGQTALGAAGIDGVALAGSTEPRTPGAEGRADLGLLPPLPRGGDPDGDGLDHRTDDCPLLAEDLDGFEDGDGCPELDDDEDGIPDARDSCPRLAETLNDYDDDDGCPDEVPRELVDVAGVVRGITFETGSAVLRGSSLPTLREVAAVLATDPTLHMRIEGHTDSVGQRISNVRLSGLRAQSVADELVDLGVARSRLTVVGYGPDIPVADNATASGRARNRRVELSYSRQEQP